MSEEKDAKLLSVDQAACIGCGSCVGVAPDYFLLNDDGKSEVIKKEVSEADLDMVNEATTVCPVQAISFKKE